MADGSTGSLFHSVLSSVNAPYGTNLTATELAARLVDPAGVTDFDASAFAFYSEVSPALQIAFLDGMGIDRGVARRMSNAFSDLAGYRLALAC